METPETTAVGEAPDALEERRRAPRREPPDVAKWVEAPLLASASLAIVALFVVRLVSITAGYRYPGVTGFEGPGILGVHAVCLGQPVYHDLSQSAVVHLYNFLFYQLYGTVARLSVGCGIDLLLATRLLSALLALTASAALALQAKGTSPMERLLLGVLLLGPLVGWWATSVRPDVGALLCFVVSYAAFAAALAERVPARRVAWLALAGTALFLSWSFKQVYLHLAPVMLAFALRRSWRDAIAFGAPVAVLTAATFTVLGTDAYVLHTMTLPAEHPFVAAAAADNAMRFAIKGGPVFLAACWLLLRQRRLRVRTPRWSLDVVALASSLLFCAVTAAKFGASDNYYLPAYAISAMIIAASAATVAAAARTTCFAALAGGMLLLTLPYLGGLVGQAQVTDERTVVDRASALLVGAPRPKLVVDEFLALPWLAGDPEQAVLDPEVYAMNVRPRTRRLEDAVARGDFATVAYTPSALPETMKGAFDLRLYALQATVGDLQVWIRRDGVRP